MLLLCPQEASQLFYASPRLWLRLAECCIAAYLMAKRQEADAAPGDPLVPATVGRGAHRKLLLPVSTGADFPALQGGKDASGGDGTGGKEEGEGGMAREGPLTVGKAIVPFPLLPLPEPEALVC